MTPSGFTDARQILCTVVKEEKEMIEDEMVGWHHRFNGHESEQASRDGEGQGSLECCSPWGGKALDTTERLNNNRVKMDIFLNCKLLGRSKPGKGWR